MMAGLDVGNILQGQLSGLDEDILTYLQSVIEDMSISERKSSQHLFDTISPFLIDAGFAAGEDECMEKCQIIAVAFGGSGYKGSGAAAVEVEDDAPLLLSAPVKLKDQSDLANIRQLAFEMVSMDNPFESTLGQNSLIEIHDKRGTSSNFADPMDVKAIPTTQKEMRKQRKANEILQRILRTEALARAKAEAELSAARMAAIKASRALGRQSNTGVSIERFSIPHPTGTGDLLTDAALTLAPGHRYGLIGKNGAGKSTLLRHIAQYKLPNLTHLRILLVDQHVEGDEFSPLEWVLRADVERTALMEEEVKLTGYIHQADTLPPEMKGVNLEMALQECYERMETIGVSSAEMRARKILGGLGFTSDMTERPTISLSGGWAMRAALSAALYVNPNLLLLDEPTNHLDLHALVWLENWLTHHFNGIAVVVSHDVVFLNTICTDIMEFTSILAGQSKTALTPYSGDFANYEAVKEEQRIQQARLRAQYEREKEKLTEFIQREGKKYDTPQHQGQRKMKMKQLEKMIEVERLETDAELVLRFPTPYSSFAVDEKMVAMENVSFAWPVMTDNNGSTTDESLASASSASVVYQAPLFERVSLTIRHGSRIVVLGKNGSGKTCLLQLLSGELSSTAGSVTRHVGSRIRVLQQHHYKGEQLDPSLSPLEHMRRMPQHESSAVGLHDLGTRQEETAQRAYLANFGIVGARATIPVKYLSGGQRMRVAMAVAFYARPDVLILVSTNIISFTLLCYFILINVIR